MNRRRHLLATAAVMLGAAVVAPSVASASPMNAAAELAAASDSFVMNSYMLAGKDPSAVGLTLSKFDDPQAASHNIQALLLPAQVITQANISDVITAGALMLFGWLPNA